MYRTLHWVRLVLLGVVLAGPVKTAIAEEFQSLNQVSSFGGQPAASVKTNFFARSKSLTGPDEVVVPRVPFHTDTPATNSYDRPLPVPETPDIFLGMAGIGVMLMLRRFFKR